MAFKSGDKQSDECLQIKLSSSLMPSSYNYHLSSEERTKRTPDVPWRLALIASFPLPDSLTGGPGFDRLRLHSLPRVPDVACSFFGSEFLGHCGTSRIEYKFVSIIAFKLVDSDDGFPRVRAVSTNEM
jgi:hypothetical protein